MTDLTPEQLRVRENIGYLAQLALKELREYQLGHLVLAYLRRIDHGTTA